MPLYLFRVLALAALLLPKATSLAQNASRPSAIIGVDVIPMDRERILRAQSVIVERGVITYIGPAQSIELRRQVGVPHSVQRSSRAARDFGAVRASLIDSVRGDRRYGSECEYQPDNLARPGNINIRDFAAARGHLITLHSALSNVHNDRQAQTDGVLVLNIDTSRVFTLDLASR